MLKKLEKTATPFYLSLWPGLTRWELIFRVSVSEYKLGLLPHGLVIRSLITIKHRSKNLKGSHQRRSPIWFHHSIFFSQRQEGRFSDQWSVITDHWSDLSFQFTVYRPQPKSVPRPDLVGSLKVWDYNREKWQFLPEWLPRTNKEWRLS